MKVDEFERDFYVVSQNIGTKRGYFKAFRFLFYGRPMGSIDRTTDRSFKAVFAFV